MARLMERYQDEKGPSARHLVLMFLAAVAVCAVFFALGFVVGYNQSPSKVTPVTENVNGSGNVPPTVNPPAGGSSQSLQTENVSPGSASVPKPEHPQPLAPEPVATAHPKAKRPSGKAVARKAPKSRPAAAAQTRSAPSATPTSGSHFAVQVMASKARGDAENLVKLLKSHGYHVYVLSPQQAHAKDNLYRVQVGPFPSRVAADQARDKLEGEGFRPFVVH